MKIDCEGEIFETIYINFHELGNTIQTDEEIDRVSEKIQRLVGVIEELFADELGEEFESEPLTVWVTTTEGQRSIIS